jgi:hypothetical protein
MINSLATTERLLLAMISAKLVHIDPTELFLKGAGERKYFWVGASQPG